MAQAHGGARPGAGRKPRAQKHATAINRAEKRIADKLPEILDKAFQLCDGIFVEDFSGDGRIVYQKPPDRAMIQYLVDRIMGKPTERKEISGNDGEPIDVRLNLESPRERLLSKLSDLAERNKANGETE